MQVAVAEQTQTLHEMQMECVTEYAQKTGRTVEECVAEAFDDWIRNVAAITLQNDTSQQANIIMFPANNYIH